MTEPVTMTLSHIRVLLWHHFSPLPYPDDGANYVGIYSDLVAFDLIRPTGGCCAKTTERGRVYAEALRDVPLPVQKWVMP